METGKKINHWCVLCGAGYHSCDLCSKTTAFTPWRTLTDTLEHFRIFMVLKDYNNQIIDREHAKELLSALDLSGHETYRESARRLLADIYGGLPIERRHDVE
ncbi:MAG: hypothetical protein HFI51_00850 [Lachnospiraceae bacterium]|nr:hypothetical protein [Lachnospiraceae bacterium]